MLDLETRKFISKLVYALVMTGLLAACNGPAPGSAQISGPGSAETRVKLGAEVLLETRLDALRGKRVGLVANSASMVYDTLHIADALQRAGIALQVVFAPEHGFRGEQEAGAAVENGRDAQTGLRIASLYGANHHPPAAEMQQLDAILFDIQDVGCRFYTYVSTLAYVMEACAKHRVKLLVLDRPNPNGWYAAGPVLQPAQASFVGLHPVPIVHGLTLGEYARMVNYEHWLPGGATCPLEVVKMEGYNHAMRWAQTGRRWVPPSPNLRTPLAAELYPALCWFEGTEASVGRGTPQPFEQLGMPQHTALRNQLSRDSAMGYAEPQPYRLAGATGVVVAFVPQRQRGRAENPPHLGRRCYGIRFSAAPDSGHNVMRLGLELLLNFFKEYHASFDARGLRPSPPFFHDSLFFDKLAGTPTVRQAILRGESAERILEGWQGPLRAFLNMRNAHLLYP